MTKTQKRVNYIQKFIYSDYTSVMNYYARPSYTKVTIEQSIKRQMLERNGKRYRVLGGNSSYFTCAYVYPKNDTWVLVIETSGKHLEYDLTYEEVDLLCL